MTKKDWEKEIEYYKRLVRVMLVTHEEALSRQKKEIIEKLEKMKPTHKIISKKQRWTDANLRAVGNDSIDQAIKTIKGGDYYEK